VIVQERVHKAKEGNRRLLGGEAARGQAGKSAGDGAGDGRGDGDLNLAADGIDEIAGDGCGGKDGAGLQVEIGQVRLLVCEIDGILVIGQGQGIGGQGGHLIDKEGKSIGFACRHLPPLHLAAQPGRGRALAVEGDETQPRKGKDGKQGDESALHGAGDSPGVWEVRPTNRQGVCHYTILP
jgi:hypothetical protein